MKKTRNLFVLKGNQEDVNAVLKELQFKGITTLTGENITEKLINDVFSNNKSVLTNSKSLSSFGNSIDITVIHGILPVGLQKPYIDVSSSNIVEQFEKIAEENNCDIGDHKSNSSGLKGIPSIDDCSYCKHLHNNYDDRCVYTSENFFVIPTLGQFIKGYLLIIPKRHIMSMAELSQNEFEEFITVLEDIKYILKMTYNNSHILVWENGTGNNGIGKAKDSIVHAHTHIVPSSLTPNLIKEKSGINFTLINPYDLSKFGKHSYLLLLDDKFWIINDDSNLYIPRQFIRQLLAEDCNITGEQWNWRLYPFNDLIHQTLKDIFDSLRKNWDYIPERIKENTIKFL